MFYGTVGIFGSIFERSGKFMGWIVRAWAKTILKHSFIKYKVTGEENLKSGTHYFFAANHESEFDIPLVFAGIKHQTEIISKIELNFPSFDIKKSFIVFSVLFIFLFNNSFFHKLFYDTKLL